MHKDIAIVAATRSPIGRFQGGLSTVPAHDLSAQLIRAVLQSTGVAAEQIDEVILGQILTAGAGQNPARQAAVNAGLPYEVPSMSLNKLCGSGLKAVHLAAQAIALGDADLVLAGGQESMSLAPFVVHKARTGLGLGHAMMDDTLLRDGLTDAFHNYHMGITAENLAERYGITREQQDAFAVESQRKAVAAMEAGRFKDEITPIDVPQRKGDPVRIEADEQPRAQPRWSPWPSCVLPSRKTARLPPATRPPSTTVQLYFCWPAQRKPRNWACPFWPGFVAGPARA